MDINQIKEQLLNLSNDEKSERKKARRDYFFYKGKCENLQAAKLDKDLLGQNWEVEDNLDYVPTQDIRNRVKPLLKKQARFMFGKEPTITLKPDRIELREICEEIRRFIDDVFEDTKFWKKTKQAFLMSTIKKRVLVRIEANPGQSIHIKYEDIDNFTYKEINDSLVEVSFFEEDKANAYAKEDTDKRYYIHTYFYNKLEETEETTVWYKKETFKGDDLQTVIEQIEYDTNLYKIPCWLIKNGGELGDEFGESDVDDISEIQTQYNKRISDFADALRFQMFGVTNIIDGDEDDVNKLTIAPGALHAIKTRQDLGDNSKQAKYELKEFNIGSSDAINTYLDRAKEDMNFALDMPSLKELNNIPSAKAMKYLYNDLIIRCEDKWSDWEPIFREVIEFLLMISKLCYPDRSNDVWQSLNYTILFQHNYPLPSDEEDKKKVAMEEVKTNVRSIKSYMKEYSDEEDADNAFNEIINEIKTLNEAETVDSFQGAINNEIIEE